MGGPYGKDMSVHTAAPPEATAETGRGAGGDRSVAGLIQTVRDATEALTAAVTAQNIGTVTDPELLDLAETMRDLAAMMRCAELAVLHEAEGRNAAHREKGLDTLSWMKSGGRYTPYRANAALRQAKELAEAPHIRARFATGGLSEHQALAMVRARKRLPEELDDAQRDQWERSLCELAHDQNEQEIPRLAVKAVQGLAPAHADQMWDRIRRREDLDAHLTRSFAWWRDRHGTVRFRGKLPAVEAAPLTTLVNATVQAIRRERAEAADTEPSPTDHTSTGKTVTCAVADDGPQAPGDGPGPSDDLTAFERAQLALRRDRADALVRLIDAAANGAAGMPRTTGLPRVLVTLSFDQLVTGLGEAEVLDLGEPVSAHRVRQLACDGDIIPVVLGADNAIVNMGRTQRLVDGALRHALTLRDRGCAFPGCGQTPDLCQAHHVVPWWQGGATDLDNTVLLCRHHHSLVEPDARSQPDSRWEVRMAPDGIPEFLRPLDRGQLQQIRDRSRTDQLPRPVPARKVLRHPRYRTPPHPVHDPANNPRGPAAAPG